MSLYSKIADIQKLNAAWSRVKKNKPACGVDNITYEDFDANIKQEIKQLNIELLEHTYEVQPVKMVPLKKENKIRMIGLYSMRDKTVQNAIEFELNKMYDQTFSNSTYAYRQEKSALVAIDEIESAIDTNVYQYVFKTDIENFFDNIVHSKLRFMLEERIKETDTIELIMKQIKTPSLDKTGTLNEKYVGIYQGASFSPVLSNLYLREFDFEIAKEDIFFVRYADDILLLTKTREKAEELESKMCVMLENLGLNLNKKKTCIKNIAEGFDYLGYHFDSNGKSIPIKAVEKLEISLEDVWLTMTGVSLDDRLKKGSQILNGWEQYYRGEKKIHNIYEYVVLVYLLRDHEELSDLSCKRTLYANKYKDICNYLITVWKEKGWKDLVIFEYAQYFDIDPVSDIPDAYQDEIIKIYDDLFRGETEELWSQLMQSYSDIGAYTQAEQVMDKVQKYDVSYDDSASTEEEDIFDADFIFDSRTVELISDLFVGREDMYTREVLQPDHTRKCEYVPEPLTRDVVREHLSGKITCGTYLVRSNDTVHYVVFDVDISKKLIMLEQDNDVLHSENMKKAAEVTKKLYGVIKNLGLEAYIEFSGYRGYHIWIFFKDWLPIRYAYSLMEIIRDKVGKIDEGITIETFPIRNKKKIGNAGQNIKLPLAVHVLSGHRSGFCTKDMQSIDNVNYYLEKIIKYATNDIKRVIGANISDVSVRPSVAKSEINLQMKEYQSLNESVKMVLDSCNLMKYLVNKAVTTGYLSHFERLSILHVFGHIGEAGKEFVHIVMSYTINYKFYVTDKFVEKMPDKPISCIKLREQYKMVSAEYGCSCAFKRTKNCYPSPVIHALRDNEEENHEITIPISQTISKDKAKVVYDELNVHTTVQELSIKLMELNKQKRGIEKSIKKVEKDLAVAFDNAQTDCMEIDVGMLVRKKTGNGEIDWIIDI